MKPEQCDAMLTRCRELTDEASQLKQRIRDAEELAEGLRRTVEEQARLIGRMTAREREAQATINGQNQALANVGRRFRVFYSEGNAGWWAIQDGEDGGTDVLGLFEEFEKATDACLGEIEESESARLDIEGKKGASNESD